MSDERKELIKRLDAYFIEHLIMAPQEVRDLFREVRAAIQPKPEIDEKYVEEKAKILAKEFVLSLDYYKDFVTQIISDVKGRGIEVDMNFLIKWQKKISKGSGGGHISLISIKKMLEAIGAKFK